MNCEKDPEPPTVKNNESCDGLPDSVCTELAKLPPITQSGEGEIACLINGKAWIAKGGGGTKYKYLADYYKGILSIGGKYYGYNPNTRNENGILSSLWIGTRNHAGEGTFDIDNDMYGTCRYINYETECHYDFEPYTIGTITVSKLDTVVTGIVSGTFEFTTYKENQTGCDNIRVSHGRFDVVL